MPTFQFLLIHLFSKLQFLLSSILNPRIKVSDYNIPFDIQIEIIKKVSDIKSLIHFRSVSKPWRSFIDSSAFINGYGARHTQPRSRILIRKVYLGNLERLFCLVDDNIEPLQVHQEFVVPPSLKEYSVYEVVGACHGLLCFYGFHLVYQNFMVLIWNPSIRKSFAICTVPLHGIDIGFGVCPVTRDPTVVKIEHRIGMPWHVEVFTLSSGIWNVIPSDNLPRQSITLEKSTQVVIDRFIYWGACEKISTDDGEPTTNHMVVSFDLITKEFKVVDLPNSLTKELLHHVSVSKLRGSLVVSGSIQVEGAVCCGVWVMELHDSSFRKLFNIGISSYKILGFRKNGEPVFEIHDAYERFTTLNVYDPCSQQIKDLGISRVANSFVMGSYKESLLLLDHSELHIYSDDC